MSNYTKTTDFGAKDSLPTGDSGKIIRGTEFETEFDAISTAIATKADIAGPTFTGTLTYETISDGTISITAFVDEDDMSSNSANLVPTQQSVKAYVDAVTTELQAQDLDFQADTGGALNIDLDTETMTFTGGTGIDTSGSGNAVTFAIDSTVATLTGTQTLTNKTLTSPDVNTPDIDGGTIDGTVIGGTTPAAVSATTVSATGNITVGGTVDGRDVATDGTKLDGIEAGATADQTAAEIRTLVEAATDSNVFTDADHSKLDGIEAGATGDQTNAEIRAAVEAATDSNVFTDADHSKLDGIEALADVTDTTNVTAAGALMDSELTNITAVKALDQGVATTDTPTFAGLATSADVSFGDNDKAVFGAGSDLQIYHDGSHSNITDVGTGNLKIKGQEVILQTGTGENSLYAATDGAVTLYHNGSAKLATTSSGIDVTGVITTDGMTTSADINFGDNDKAIFGASSDLQIYHDGSNSYIQEAGSGNLYIQGSNAIRLRSSASLENMLEALENGAVTLYYNNVAKLATTSTGIDVTGTVTADSLTSSGNLQIQKDTPAIELESPDGSSNSFKIIPSLSDSVHFGTFFKTNDVNVVKIANNGDISFYEDTGTTAKLFWDASAESLEIDGQIGITNFDALKLGTAHGGGASIAYAGDGNLKINPRSGFSTVFESGNVGIGTDNPTGLLHLSSSAPAFYMTDTTNNTEGVISMDNAGSLVFNADLNNEAGSSNIRFAVDGSEAMRIDSSGLVSIKNNTASTLRLESTDTAIATNEVIGVIDFYSNDASGIGAASRGSISLIAEDAAGAGSMLFKTSNASTAATERMRIDSSGNLLVGTTTASIAATNNTGAVIVANGASQFSRDGGHTLDINRVQDGEIVRFRSAGNAEGSISISGSTTSYNTSSDRRLKDNIVDAPSASDDIDAIQVRSFDWKADGSHQKYGMVAQELQSVAPEAVSGDADSEDMMGVDYSKLVPMMLKEIQSLRARVAQLEGVN